MSYLSHYLDLILELRQKRQPGTMHNYSYTAIARRLYKMGVRPVASRMTEESYIIRAIAGAVTGMLLKRDEKRQITRTSWFSKVWTPEEQARELEQELKR